MVWKLFDWNYGEMLVKLNWNCRNVNKNIYMCDGMHMDKYYLIKSTKHIEIKWLNNLLNNKK